MDIQEYISYIKSVKRYSARTVQIYRDSLEMFAGYMDVGIAKDAHGRKGEDMKKSIDISPDTLTPTGIRNYEVYLIEERKMVPKSVNLHLSILSGLCRYMIRQDMLRSNPVSLVTRPKVEKRLPEFYRHESMEQYFRSTEHFAGEDMLYVSEDAGQTKWMYERRLARMIVSILYSTGIRRAELICMDVSDVDLGRHTARIHGKGDKMREIPLVPSLCKEISLYLQAVETMVDVQRDRTSPLLVTFSGRRLYPMYVDRTIKGELGSVGSITGRKSPHVLRHTIATELLDEGTDLNSIKELLGHSSLATTQVYTHNSIGKLKKVYQTAHPRASKNGGQNGD